VRDDVGKGLEGLLESFTQGDIGEVEWAHKAWDSVCEAREEGSPWFVHLSISLVDARKTRAGTTFMTTLSYVLSKDAWFTVNLALSMQAI
jgi:hypothetical protein